MRIVYSLALVVSLCGVAGAQSYSGGYMSPSLLSPPSYSAYAQPASHAAGSDYGRAAGYSVLTDEAPPSATAEEVVPLEEPPVYADGPSGYGVGHGIYEDAMVEGYGSCDSCAPELGGGYCADWYGYVGGLLMTRDRPSTVWTTYPTWDFRAGTLGTRDAAVNDFNGGWEVRFGKRICCDKLLEVTYWGIDEFTEWASTRDEPNSSLIWDNVGYDSGDWGADPVWDYVDGATEHRIHRTNEFHNLEINLINLSTGCGSGCGSGCGLSCNWSFGARYFRFDEHLQFASVAGGWEFGEDPAAESRLDMDVENNLIGFQLGCDLNYCFCSCWSLYARPKIGIYGNHIRHEAVAARGDGQIAYDDLGREFRLRASKNDVSMLGSLDVGLAWQIKCCLRAHMGYRVVGATGLALADDQFPTYMADFASHQDIDSTGSLLLHGAYAGLEWRY